MSRKNKQPIRFEDVRNITAARYFRDSGEFSLRTYQDKYPMNDDERQYPALLFQRVAKIAAQYEKNPSRWATRWFDQMWRGVWRPAGSIMAGLGHPGSISTANCFSGDTEFITKEGVRRFNVFADMAPVVVLTNDGQLTPAVVRRFGKQPLMLLTTERQGRTSRLLVTPNHRWGVRRCGRILLLTTCQLAAGDDLPVNAVGCDTSTPADAFSLGAWRVVSCVYTGLKEEVFCVQVPGKENFTLANDCGTKNCTTIGIRGDTLEDIFRAAYETAKAAAFRQGLGIDFSRLRPRGMKIRNSAKESSGATHWMEFINSIGQYVGQKGRKPALLLSISVRHPDVLEFITLKSNQHKVENANISVQITDDFMKACQADSDWTLEFNTDHGERLEQVIKARAILDLITKEACAYAEPGVQFIDTCRRESMTDVVGYPVVSSNACFAAESELLTVDGSKKIGELNGQVVKLINATGRSSEGRVWCSGIKRLVSLRYKEGRVTKTLRVTPDQRLLTNRGEEIEARMTAGKRLMPFLKEPSHTSDFVSMGFMPGRGQLTRLGNPASRGLEVNIGADDMDVLPLFSEEIQTNNRKTYIYTRQHFETMRRLGFDPSRVESRILPSTYDSWEISEKAGFLCGCFSANGYAINTENFRIGYKSSSKKLIDQLQNTLLVDFGIESYITTSPAKKIKWPNGAYVSKPCYDLNIGKFSSQQRFYNLIGFIQRYKVSAMHFWLCKHSPLITSVVDDGTEEVYDFSEPETHWGVVNGFVAHNCSEKFMALDSTCVLASLNVAHFPLEGYQQELKTIGRGLVRFLDNVVQYELDNRKTPFENQHDVVSQLREVGVGVTNLHGWLLKGRVAYDSDDGIRRIEEFIKALSKACWQASIDLGREKGSAPAFRAMVKKMKSADFVAKSAFGKRMLEEGLQFRTLRNMNVMSIAPTGSLSMSFPEEMTSMGIEPVIGYYWWKRSRTSGDWKWYFCIPRFVRDTLQDAGLSNVPISIEDPTGEIGEKWIQHIEKHFDPTTFKPAHLLDPLRKVEMMARVARWVDSSISVTYNLPESATPDVVREIYMKAWESGVKSVSVYRDKSRQGVIEFESPRKVEARFARPAGRPDRITVHAGAARPQDLPCDIHRVQAQGEKFVVFVGLLEGMPYEVIAAMERDLGVPGSMDQGIVRKVKTGARQGDQYQLVGQDGVIVQDLANHINKEFSDYTRLISTSLRHGVPIDFIVSQLRKSESSVVSFSKAIARVLVQYVGEYYRQVEGKGCRACGSVNLEFKEGCFSCLDCGHSKCG